MKNLYFRIFKSVFNYPCRLEIKGVLNTYHNQNELKYKIALTYVCGVDFTHICKWYNISEFDVKFYLSEIAKERK